MRPYLKNTQHRKGLAEWLKWYSACLASVRPWVQIPVPQKERIARIDSPLIILYISNPLAWQQYQANLMGEQIVFQQMVLGKLNTHTHTHIIYKYHPQMDQGPKYKC
jgi:hypothetical protein